MFIASYTQVVLDALNIQVGAYWLSEIYEDALTVSKANQPSKNLLSVLISLATASNSADEG